MATPTKTSVNLSSSKRRSIIHAARLLEEEAAVLFDGYSTPGPNPSWGELDDGTLVAKTMHADLMKTARALRNLVNNRQPKNAGTRPCAYRVG
jgi:hypothetical protein